MDIRGRGLTRKRGGDDLAVYWDLRLRNQILVMCSFLLPQAQCTDPWFPVTSSCLGMVGVA